MKFRDIIQKHLLTEGRTKGASKGEAFRFFNDHCNNLNSKIIRGIKGFDEDFGIVRPKQFKRLSANSKNYYTLLIDNFPEWSLYPKRSESIICTTDTHKALNYGSAYRVFPASGYKIGVCPKGDIWESFRSIEEALDTQGSINTMNTFNITLQLIVENSISINLSNDPGFNKLKSCLNKIKISDLKKALSNSESDFGFYRHRVVTFSEFWEKHYKESNLFQFVRQLMNPTKNRFKYYSSGDDITESKSEIWTDAPSLLVAHGRPLNSFKRQYRNEI